MTDIIQGLVVGGTLQIIISNNGHAVVLELKQRDRAVEAALSVEQSRRVRRLLSAAEKRAAQ